MFPPKMPMQPGAGLTDPQQTPGQMPGAQMPATGPTLLSGPKTFSDPQLLEMWKRWKQESFDQRWIYERQWMRNVWYILNRQWIYFDAKRGAWQDKRLAKWVPRPVTNILKDAVQAVRANFASINYGTNARPLGNDNKNIVTASVADDLTPILYEDHKMDAILNEFDFWLLVCGNAWLHTCVEYDRAHGVVQVHHEVCATCGEQYAENQIADAGQKCPNCGGTQFSPALDDQGQPIITDQPMPKGITIPLSPFEIAFPLVYERYELAPYTVRMRWRDKSYYEQHEDLQQYAKTLSFSKSPQERTMQIFKTLPFQSDLGIAPPFFAAGGANSESEGIVEYDVWIKPCADFPDGQVIRFAGDGQPTVIHSEKENLPGPLPYHDAKGNPIFTFHHARYESVGGRALGSSLIDPAIQKQDQLNQLDSYILMCIGRTANPVWLEPKGAEVEKFTGEPGLVVKWNPLVAGGNAKPERIPGEQIPDGVFEYRQLIKAEAEELLGTNDLLKGQKPAGVEAYASLSLLVERGQAKHASAYKERGAAMRGWYKDALEIEREFGPESRVRAVMMPSRQWAFNTFQKADLSGSVDIVIEDGTLAPKTSLGERAAIEHLRQLGLLNPNDPDQVMTIYEKFGQTSLLPSLDAQVQEAWLNMDRFEKFLQGDPEITNEVRQRAMAAIQQIQQTGLPMTNPPMSPLIYKRWYNPQVHRQELIKWCLSDRGRMAFKTSPNAEGLVTTYLQTIDLAMMQTQQGMLDATGQPPQPVMQPVGGAPGAGAPAGAPGGAGAAMANSNRNAAGAGPAASGSAGAAANAQGPASTDPTQQPGSPVDLARQMRAITYLEKAGGNPAGAH